PPAGRCRARRRPRRRPGLQRPAGLLRRRDVPRLRAPARRTLPRRAAPRPAHPPRPAPDGQRRERAVSPAGQPARTDPPAAGIPGRRGGGRTVRRPGGGADRLRRPAWSEESPAPAPGRLAMKPLIWKEWRENLKWVGLPALLILLPMLLGGPGEPMFGTG